MNRSNWRDTAELIGIAAIVASLVFVGFELRQSQQIAFAEQEGSQIADFMAINDLIARNSSLINRLNNAEELGDDESIVADQLVWSIWSMHFFTRQRAYFLDHPSVGIQERALAVIFFENPGLRKVWSTNQLNYEKYFEAMGRPRRGAIGEFNEALGEHLSSLDDMK